MAKKLNANGKPRDLPVANSKLQIKDGEAKPASKSLPIKSAVISG